MKLFQVLSIRDIVIVEEITLKTKNHLSKVFALSKPAFTK